VVMFAYLQRSGYILVALNEITLWGVHVSLPDGVSSRTDFFDLAAWIGLFLLHFLAQADKWWRMRLTKGKAWTI
jgi:hypothetical protein